MIQNLKNNWCKFLGVVLGPGSVLFTILTIVSLIVAFLFKTNTLFATLLSVLGSVFAGVAGSFIKDDYNHLATENALEKKGRSALRNLEAIRSQIFQIREWIVSFKKTGKEGQRALEETDRHLSTILLNITAGLADWVDVVPELQESQERVIELDKKEKEVLQSYMLELLEKRKELVVSKDEKRVDELKKKIGSLEKQIKEIQADSTRSIGITGPSIAGSIPYSGVSAWTLDSRCMHCGKMFTPDYSDGMGVFSNLVCKECKDKTGK